MNSIQTSDNKAGREDFYLAYLENGELVMQPFCACGNMLDENYYCETCSRQCRCYLIVCKDGATLAQVQANIRKSPQFSVYRAKLAGVPQG